MPQIGDSKDVTPFQPIGCHLFRAMVSMDQSAHSPLLVFLLVGFSPTIYSAHAALAMMMSSYGGSEEGNHPLHKTQQSPNDASGSIPAGSSNMHQHRAVMLRLHASL